MKDKEISPQLSEEKLLTRDEVAQLLHCNLVTLWRHTRANKIPHYKIGRKMLFRKSEILEKIKVK